MEKIFIEGRLTKKIYPLSYELAFIIDEKTHYKGTDIIMIQFNKKTNIFALHAKNIEIEKIQLDNIDIKYKYDESNELKLMKKIGLQI